MNSLKRAASAILLIVFSVVSLNVMSPTPAAAACAERFLTFPVWWRGISMGADCSVDIGATGLEKSIYAIMGNIVEIILQLVGYVCVVYMIVGGYWYLLSAGSPDKNTRGRKTILHAAVGLIISILSVAIINLVMGNIN